MKVVDHYRSPPDIIVVDPQQQVASDLTDPDLCSTTLFDGDEAEMEHHLVRKLSSSSNRSLRRKLSGCFRKQDSNEWPILKVEDTEPQHQEPQRKPSWYRRASKIIRHRSRSMDRGEQVSPISTNQEEPNIVVAQGVVRHVHRAKRGSDSMITMDQEEQQTKKKNRNLEISSLLTNASKRFLTASFNDLMVAPPLWATPRSSSISCHTAEQSTSSSSNRNQQSNLVPRAQSFIHSDSNLAIDRKPLPLQRSLSGGAGTPNAPLVGSASGTLVGRILEEEGLGKYIDQGVIRAAQQELAEAINLTQEEMDRAAHRLLQAEQRIRNVQNSTNQDEKKNSATETKKK